MFDFLDSEPNNILPASNEPDLPASINRTEASYLIPTTAENYQIYANEVASNTTNFANDFLLESNLVKNSLITTNSDTLIEDNIHQTAETRDLLTGNIADSVTGEFDNLTNVTRVQSKKQSRNASQSEGMGNSYREAVEIDDISYERYFNGLVTSADNKDFYHLNLTEKGKINIELYGLHDNADLYLRNSRGKIIKKSLKKGTSDEEINRVLKPDDYYVQVRTRNKNVNTPYDLKLNFTAFPTDNAGNNRREALEVISSQNYNDYVDKYDKKDFYTFTIGDDASWDSIKISLSGLTDNADLSLFKEGVHGKISSSQNANNADESISIDSEPGTYYLLVKSSPGSSTYYNLNIDFITYITVLNRVPEIPEPPENEPPFPVRLDFATPIKSDDEDRPEDIPTKFDKSSRLDLMVVYTPEAKEGQGGTQEIEELIQLAVDKTNKAFTNSGVKTKLRLVHTAEVDYQESGKSDRDLTQLKNTKDGYMDEVHQLRDKYGADIVSLFVNDLEIDTDTQILGKAYFMGLPSFRFREKAFNIIKADTAIENHSLSHEIGHLLGLQEDRRNSSDNPYYPYGYGYGVEGKFGTIMSYAYDYNAEKINYFSNPNKTYNDTPVGTPDENAAKAINKVLKYAANWKPSVRRRKRR